MGRFGGHELGYGSDADVLFVHDPLPGVDEKDATDAAHAVANELRRLLGVPAPEPPLVIDPDLRPEGRQGPLVRTIASYGAYYERWSEVWESQALLRAEPVAGDEELGRRFVELIDPLRYPEGGIDEAAVREIRRIKARIDAERLPRGADPARHTKLGPGGLADVEWTVQLLQLRHGAELAGSAYDANGGRSGGCRGGRTGEAGGGGDAHPRLAQRDPGAQCAGAHAWQAGGQPADRLARVVGSRACPGLPARRSRHDGR